jgi:hypothetical protein
MIRTRAGNSTLHLDSILLILFLFFGLAVFQKADYNKFDSNSTSSSNEISIAKNNATVSIGIQYCHFQKSWIPNKDNFKILSFDKFQFLVSKEVDQRILISEKSRKKYIQLPFSFNLHLLFPYESDEIPILS